MSDGNGSAAPNVWSTGFRQTFETLAGKPVFGMLVAADNKRSDEREERLTQATSSIPATIFWFLLATLVITVTALGVCLPLQEQPRPDHYSRRDHRPADHSPHHHP
ncbi:hypothetical protein [Streptomyces sp. KL116D]